MFKKLIMPLMALLMVVAVSACGKSSPSQAQLTGMDYIDGVFHNNIEKVIKTINTNELDESKLAEVREQLQAALEVVASEVEKQGGLKDIQVKDIKETSKEALISVVISFNNNTSKETMIALAKYEDNWYVVSR